MALSQKNAGYRSPVDVLHKKGEVDMVFYWNKMSWWKKSLLILVAEAIWMLMITLLIAIGVWDFSAVFNWGLARLILGFWVLTMILLGLIKGYEVLLKKEARKQNGS